MLEWLFGERSEPELETESDVQPEHGPSDYSSFSGVSGFSGHTGFSGYSGYSGHSGSDDVVTLLTRISKSIETNPDDWVVQLSGDWGNQKMGMSIDSGTVSVRIKFGGERLTIFSESFGTGEFQPRKTLIEKIRSQTDALSARRMVEKLKKLENQG